jgi:hypothetical protein
MNRLKIIEDILDGKSIRLRSKYFENNYNELYLKILDFTVDLDITFKQKLWHWVNDVKVYKVCKCGNEVNFNRNWLDGYKKYFSIKCANSNLESKEKRKKTNLKKWGVDNVAKSAEIKKKQEETNLKKWGLSKPYISSSPRWILREFFSYCLINCMSNGYQVHNFVGSDYVSITADDIFDNFYATYQHIVKQLGLTITTEFESIIQNHEIFLQKQQFHNSQINCNSWVQDILNSDTLDSVSPCQTIFDESYIQYLLRQQGYEIECDNLNIFPSTTSEMKKIIYKK